MNYMGDLPVYLLPVLLPTPHTSLGTTLIDYKKKLNSKNTLKCKEKL